MDVLQLERTSPTRLAAIQYMRIEEARDYLEILLCAFRELTHAQKHALFSGNSQVRSKAFEEIGVMIDAAAKKRFHIRSLSDSVLSELDDQLMLTVREKTGCIAESVNLMKNYPALNHELFEKITEEYRNAMTFVRRMQMRLDQLAQTLS